MIAFASSRETVLQPDELTTRRRVERDDDRTGDTGGRLVDVRGSRSGDVADGQV